MTLDSPPGDWFNAQPLMSSPGSSGSFGPRWSLLLVFLAFASLVYARLMYEVTYFPPFFGGEESRVLDRAVEMTNDAQLRPWHEVLWASAGEYNKGYNWVLLPFYQWFGYDVRLIVYVLPVFISLFCAAFFVIYREACPKGLTASFFVAVAFCVFAVCVRRYKWHTLCYLSALSVYLYFLPQIATQLSARASAWARSTGLVLLAISCFFYFGGLIYIVPLIVLVLWFEFRTRRLRGLVWTLALTVGFVGALFSAFHSDPIWEVRIIHVLNEAYDALTPAGLRSRRDTLSDLFFLYLSPPYWIFLFVGLGASWVRMRRGEAFATVNTVLLGCLWSFQLAIEGLCNPDQLNWSMIPFLGTILIGADTTLAAVRQRVRHGGVVVAVLVAGLAAWEIWKFPVATRFDGYQIHGYAEDTQAQAALVLRMIRDDPSGTTQYFLPDPSVAYEKGGFDYGVNPLRRDYAEVLGRVIHFMDEEDLAGKRRELAPGRRAVAFLSINRPTTAGEREELVKGTLDGSPAALVAPFERVYRQAYWVRRYEFH